ncbi:MAG: GNAT family N-acetyltransferase [Paludibacter sp.]|nr:GNAT family N-acetyltransferase [Paludibacter sp.]
MFELKIYHLENKKEWDDLIKKSKNGTFLFFRDYMDYHSSRFQDMSFLIYRKGKLEAVMPGNRVDDIFYSHQGLTYGGLILTNKITTIEVLDIFILINESLKQFGINTVIYKAIPAIYHNTPSDEDIYALFLLKAEKIICNISSTIFQSNKIRFIESRKSGLRKSTKEGVIVKEGDDFTEFWEMLSGNLNSKFQTKPAHSLEEIVLLQSRFPENIKLFIAELHTNIIAGTVIFLMNQTIHVQYICANEIGKSIGALDLLFDSLINNLFINIPYFDFGHSNEEMGNYLNKKLIFQKEGFGGRGIVYEVYKYNL